MRILRLVLFLIVAGFLLCGCTDGRIENANDVKVSRF